MRGAGGRSLTSSESSPRGGAAELVSMHLIEIPLWDQLFFSSTSRDRTDDPAEASQARRSH